jgi:hypothetical protein
MLLDLGLKANHVTKATSTATSGDSWALAFPRMHWWYGQRENEMEGGAGVEQGKIVLSETGNGGGITEPAISTQSDNEMHMEGGSGKEHGKNVL